MNDWLGFCSLTSNIIVFLIIEKLVIIGDLSHTFRDRMRRRKEQCVEYSAM